MDNEDYEIIGREKNKNNSIQYIVRCKVCGHTKVCGGSNWRKQNRNHSSLNCKEDFYKSLIGTKICDYICDNITYSIENGFMAELHCDICGHKLTVRASDLLGRNNFKHIPNRCRDEYYKSEIGNVYGDFKIIKLLGIKRKEMFVECECIKCHTIIQLTLRSLKENKFIHGVQCMKYIKDDEFKHIVIMRHANMKQRCTNPKNTNYNHYGARRIELKYEYPIDLYYDFIDELREYSKTHDIRNCTFDRIDVNGNYEKSNLRIADQSIQSANTTRQKYFIIQKDDITVLSDNAMECGRKLGINGRGLGNVVRGTAKSCGGWKLVGIVEKSEIPNIKNVTTKIITT